MSSRPFLVLCLLSAFSLGGCRQPDGPLPAAEGEVPNRLADISRDLQSVASGQADATGDLTDDLRVFGDKPGAAAAIDELSRGVARALSGKTLAEDRAMQLSRHLWTTVAARQLSEKQVETLRNDVQSTLVAIGAAEPSARGVAAQAGEVQRQVADRNRRWYELY